jgi:hypothetical protein
MVPPLPPGFQIFAISSISMDHAASSVVVLLATHQQAEDVMMALLKEVHFLFANGMFRFFFINYFFTTPPSALFHCSLHRYPQLPLVSAQAGPGG